MTNFSFRGIGVRYDYGFYYHVDHLGPLMFRVEMYRDDDEDGPPFYIGTYPNVSESLEAIEKHYNDVSLKSAVIFTG